VTLDGASLGKIASGCFCAISFSDGKVSGSAIAIATQSPTTAQGQRTTKSANRRISALIPGRRSVRGPATLADARSSRAISPVPTRELRISECPNHRCAARYATRPQCPLSATRVHTDFIASMYRVTDFKATGLSGYMIAMTVPSPYRKYVDGQLI